MDTTHIPYTVGMATGEIIILLVLTFLMGMLLCWLLRQMGLCCKSRKKPISAGKYHTREFDIHASSTPTPDTKPVVPDVYIPKVKVQHRIVATLGAIDPHKPIIDPPDPVIEPDIDIDIPEVKPDMAILPLEPLSVVPATHIALPNIDPLLAAIDPHKPIIDPPDMPEEPHTSSGNSNLFNDWLHKAKDSVEHLTEKATPATTEWLHKAKDSVEHLTEKATPATTEWLHKAKEIGSNISAKSHNINASETLAKGSSTLAALATSAKELTEKLASNLSSKPDDLQKLVGIGPTFASILHRAGIHTYQQLADTSVQKLQALLIVEDEQFSQHDTSSWPRQAALAAYGEWDQLKAYQDSL